MPLVLMGNLRLRIPAKTKVFFDVWCFEKSAAVDFHQEIEVEVATYVLLAFDDNRRRKKSEKFAFDDTLRAK